MSKHREWPQPTRARADIVDVTPAPRPKFKDPGEYHQPANDKDGKRFLARTRNQPGHTFTDTGRR